MNPSDKVVLLDPATDKAIGEMGKVQSHVKGRYHAAFSVLLFRSDGSQLVQKRASAKYHSGGLWANACCSHTRLGENAATSVASRLLEEIGVSPPLHQFGVIRYRAPVRGPGGEPLIEHERVELFAGVFDGVADPNPSEVAHVRWVKGRDAKVIPSAELAPWFKLYLDVIDMQQAKAVGSQIDYGFFDIS